MARQNPAAARSRKARTTRGRRPSETQIRNKAGRANRRQYFGSVVSRRQEENFSAYSAAEGYTYQGDIQAAKQAKKRHPDQSKISAHTSKGRRKAIDGTSYDASPAFRKKQRARDTRSALHRADASMYNYDG